jgi:lysophospholipase L1-like esterase
MADESEQFRIPKQPKVALVGDSVLAGLGVHGRSYGRLTAKQLDAVEVLQLARSTYTVLDALEKIERLKAFGPDLVIVCVGGSDALVHPSRSLERLMDRYAPKSWQGADGLEPRPWFTGTRYERARQRATTFAKVTVKNIGIRMTGGYQRVPLPLFDVKFGELLDSILSLGSTVVVVGLHDCDERLFPRSNRARAPYEAAIQQHVADRPGVVLVEIKDLLVPWDDYLPDHAHLSEQGHAKVTAAMIENIERIDRVRPSSAMVGRHRTVDA